MKTIPNRVYLTEDELPKQYYNIAADMPTRPKPYLNPVTKEPVQPDDLAPLFAKELIAQEVSTERYIDIPKQVREIYAKFRPSPLIRAYGLEKALDTPAKIYYKYEGNNPSGSHKLNSAIPQAFYNKAEGVRRLTTETGAGQWGSALSIAAQMFGLECTVYMVRVSYEQKPYRRTLMQTYGANVIASPSTLTNAGRAILEKDPDSLGSLGIAISEAVEDAVMRDDTHYALGSVLNHVILHQTIIGLEAKKQFEKIDEYPDIVIGCNGGGSNFSGCAFPFLHDKLKNGAKTEFVAVEPAACPKLTKGKFAYDYGDTAKMAPIAMMYTLGHDFVPAGIHAGGLRYHGDSALLSQLYHDGYVSAAAVRQTDVFKAAVLFARSEIILPAPESAHAIAYAIQKALECRETGEAKTIFFNLSGHGDFDLAAYEEYLAGRLQDFEYTDEMLEKCFSTLPEID
ncbi:MAG: TrpB-like pyridoxal phosphate-dependent enzyme [Christensenellaceae bacterium]|nr:TrpB-like pyridoxal phosphate-dependent enzyme [Christensenellaceae bacterium]